MTGFEEVLEAMAAEGFEDSILEFLRESKQVFKKDAGKSRWWQNWEVVVQIGEKYYRYLDARSDDRSAQDAGWEFEPEWITRVYPKQISTIIYTDVPQPE